MFQDLQYLRIFAPLPTLKLSKIVLKISNFGDITAKSCTRLQKSPNVSQSLKFQLDRTVDLRVEKFRRVLHQNSKAPDIPADILDKVGAAGDVPHC